jgi:hypothetical protein
MKKEGVMRSLPVWVFICLAPLVFGAEHTVDVYKQSGRFAGWPANYGAWSWGNEILVGFEAGSFHERKPGEHEHSIDYKKPSEHLLARSLDGGETWKIEKPPGLLAPPHFAWRMWTSVPRASTIRSIAVRAGKAHFVCRTLGRKASLPEPTI